jgi:hypothetical protein
MAICDCLQHNAVKPLATERVHPVACILRDYADVRTVDESCNVWESMLTLNLLCVLSVLCM